MITRPSVDLQEVLVDQDPYTFIAVAYDPEGSALDFDWFLTPPRVEFEATEGTPDGDDWFATATLPLSPRLDGAILELTITDDSRNTVTVEWALEVEQ